MKCALCELEGVPETNTGICPECWEELNTSSEFEGRSIEIELSDDGKRKQIKIKKEEK